VWSMPDRFRWSRFNSTTQSRGRSQHHLSRTTIRQRFRHWTGAMSSPPSHLTPEAVASLPPPGLSTPSQLVFSPPVLPSTADDGRTIHVPEDVAAAARPRYLAFVSSSTAVLRTVRTPSALYRPLTAATAALPNTSTNPSNHSYSNSNGNSTSNNPTASSSERVLLYLDLSRPARASAPGASHSAAATTPRSLLSLARYETKHRTDATEDSLEERLRRERQRATAGSGALTQFRWTWRRRPSPITTTNSSQPTTPPPLIPPNILRLLIPNKGSLWIQDGLQSSAVRCIHDKATANLHAMDAQLSPDGSMVAWTADGDVYVQAVPEYDHSSSFSSPPIRVTTGAVQSDTTCIAHGVADFVAQEEMDRYRGFWWHPDSCGILVARVDESSVPVYRIMHQEVEDGHAYEDHRYPFAGKENPTVRLAFVPIDSVSVAQSLTVNRKTSTPPTEATATHCHDDDTRQDVDGSEAGADPMDEDDDHELSAQSIADLAWDSVVWLDPPREATEYLARVYWLPDGSAVAQWQNRTQTVTVWQRIPVLETPIRPRTLVMERTDVWINLHHMFHVLPEPVAPQQCGTSGRDPQIPPFPAPLPPGAFSFLLASERSGFQHLYLYTYCPGINGEQAVLLRTVSAGEWIVESIVGVDMDRDVVFFTGTYDSVLERHLYALPLTYRDEVEGSNEVRGEEHPTDHNGVRRGLSKVMSAFSPGKHHKVKANGMDSDGGSTVRPIRLTVDSGMHSIVMDEDCEIFADTSSDLDRPTSVKIYEVSKNVLAWNQKPSRTPPVQLLFTLYDAMNDDKSMVAEALAAQSTIGRSAGSRLLANLPAPELLKFPTSDGSEMLHAALYRPDARIHGPGPYPLICAVYGGPHVQRVNRSWSQCADMRAQRLRSLGFCVVKCDNRGSSRRGLAFESAISRRLGRLEVLDQVAAVRQLAARGVADPNRVGIYGWSYGGYLSAMCLCRAPDVFHAAVAGAPVTSWDGYDTHYTERYMGLPSDNPAGYRESALFEHIPNMSGSLLMIHGLIDENVHFRHTARLINKLVASGKSYELCIFPDERHSPRRLRDRIYMEQRIGDFFVERLQRKMDLMDVAGGHRNGGGNSNDHNVRALRSLAGHL
jgi:dipeptidyl-peptidase-4